MPAQRTIGQSTGGKGTATLKATLKVVLDDLGLQAIELPPLYVASSSFSVLNVDLASGDNAITVPTAAAAVIGIPPVGNAVAWAFKAATGTDTGAMRMIASGSGNAAGWDHVVLTNAAPATIYIFTGAIITDFTLIFY